MRKGSEFPYAALTADYSSECQDNPFFFNDPNYKTAPHYYAPTNMFYTQKAASMCPKQIKHGLNRSKTCFKNVLPKALTSTPSKNK